MEAVPAGGTIGLALGRHFQAAASSKLAPDGITHAASEQMARWHAGAAIWTCRSILFLATLLLRSVRAGITPVRSRPMPSWYAGVTIIWDRPRHPAHRE